MGSVRRHKDITELLMILYQKVGGYGTDNTLRRCRKDMFWEMAA